MMNILKLNIKLPMLLVMMVAMTGAISYAEAASRSPFSPMAGSWRGSGRVTPPGGQAERVRCRVSYKVYGRGNKLNQRIKCAGSGYWITATSNLRYTPGNRKIRGSWKARYGDRGKSQKTSNGAVHGDVINGVISISLVTKKGTGNMTVRMNGKRRQSVTIDHIIRLDLRR